MTEDTKRVLLAGGFGLVGTLIPVFMSWIKERDIVSRRSKQLDEATKRVQFWDQWLKLSTAIGDPADQTARQRVQHELEMLCQLLSGASAQLHIEQAVLQNHMTTFQAKLRNMSFIRRLLLLYRPARGIAWIPRIFFFFLILVTAIGLCAPPYTQDTAWGVGAMLFLAAIFWFLSHWIEKPRKETSEVGAVPVSASPAS